MSEENQFSDLPFWLQRNWTYWASIPVFGMYYWARQEQPQ